MIIRDRGSRKRRRSRASFLSIFLIGLGLQYGEAFCRNHVKCTAHTAVRAASDAEEDTADVYKQLEDTHLQMERQQDQIDSLIKLMQTQQQQQQQHQHIPPPPQTPHEQQHAPLMQHGEQQLGSIAPAEGQTSTVAPLKVMLFIDGTWLYYSIHERDETLCPIKRKFGHHWQRSHKVDWATLPRVVAQNLRDPGWTSSEEKDRQEHHQRPIEIVRAFVFTSYKADTSVNSYRYRMFQEMQNNNYDVCRVGETVGNGEKCVDIQLAVEMLHYATVPGAYDVALILTGDKDFCPAMIRTRQKARKVGLVSMKMGCNRALHDTPGIKDYDVVWLDDHLDDIIVPKADFEMNEKPPEVSIYTLLNILLDFVLASTEEGRVTSRDLGRYFKYLQLGDGTVLSKLKASHGGMKQFLSQTGAARIEEREDKYTRMDPSDRAFWIRLDVDKAKQKLAPLAETVKMNDDEKAFWTGYSTDVLKDKAKAYQHTLLITGALPEYMERLRQDIPKELEEDFSSFKVSELKDFCREQSLPVSGTKAVLLKRVQDFVAGEIAKRKEEQGPMQLEHLGGTEFLTSNEVAARFPNQASNSKPRGKISQRAKDSTSQTNRSASPPKVQTFLKEVLSEYLQASHGRACSRNVGRYLAQHKSSDDRTTSLDELKRYYGGLAMFVKIHSDEFEIYTAAEVPEGSKKPHQFDIGFREVVRR